jgi:hypothetical protein
MALGANERQRSAVPLQDPDGRLIVVGPDGVPISGGAGGGGADPLSDGSDAGALPTKTLWVAGADGTVLRGLRVDASGRARVVVEGTPAISVSNFPGSQAVTGPLTDAQLRASNVPVSGPVTDTQLRASAVPVSGPLTDTQLRASAVPVSGPLTDTQLRASAVPVSDSRLPAALDADGGLKAHVQNTVPVTGTFFQGTQPVSLASVPTVTEKQDQPANTTTTWTSATTLNTALTNSNVAGYGTATISIQTPSTATAGAITIEVTDDGAVWYPATATRIDNGLSENPVLLAGPGIVQSRMYAVSVDAMTGIRVRLSTLIVGTGNTIIRLGLIAGGIEPFVSIVPPRNPVTLLVDRAAGLTVEALATISIQRGDTAATSGTTYVPTAGKTFRLVSIHYTAFFNSTVVLALKVFIRSLQSGTVTATSPVRFHTDLHASIGTAANGQGLEPVWMSGDASAGLFDVPPGGSLGISHVSSNATYNVTVVLTGFEF